MLFKKFDYNVDKLSKLMIVNSGEHSIIIFWFSIDAIDIIPLFPPEAYLLPSTLDKEIK